MTDSSAAQDRRPEAVAATGSARLDSPRTDAETEGLRVVQREKDRFSGMRFFLGFFGWLTATGLTVLLLAAVAAVGALVGVPDLSSGQQLQAAGVGGVIALLVVLLIAYFSGGYVAGRMARFSGAKQGVAVWLWAVVIAVLLGVAGAVAGGSAGADLSSLPRLPLSASTMTLAGIGAAVAVLVVTLVGAILGGLAGMRYHRRVDRAGVAAPARA